MRWMKETLAVIVLATACLAPVAYAQDRGEALRAEVQALLGAMDRAVVGGDIEAALTFYADAAVVLPNNAPKIVGKASLRKRMEENRKLGVSFGSFTGTVDEAWECGGLVYCVGRYALAANVPGQARPVGDKGKSFAVFSRSADGRLQLLYDIWNTDVEYGR